MALSYYRRSWPVINPQITRDSKVHDFVSYSLTESFGSPMSPRAFSAIPGTTFLRFAYRLAQGCV